MKLTLRKKLGISLSILILITIVALGVSSYINAQAIVLDEIRFNNEQAINNVNDFYLRNFMEDMSYVVTAWAQRPEIVNYQKAPGQMHMVRDIPSNFKTISNAWTGYLSGNPDIAWLYLGLEADGSLLLSPLDRTMPLDYDCRTREWYQETVSQKDKTLWTQPYLDAGESGETVVTVSRAVWNDGVLVGVVGMDIKLRKFSELIKGINAGGDGYLMLMGANGDIYAHPDSGMLTHNLSGRQWIKGILTTDHGTDFFNENGQQYIYSYLTVENTGWKLVNVRPVNLPAAIGKIRSWTLDATILAGVFILLSSILLTKVILKPLNALMQRITRVSEGDMETRMTVGSQDEFGVLSDTFNKMLDRINSLVQERDQHVDTLTELLGEIRGGYITTVRALANAIEASDYYTRGHCDRVRHYALLLGNALNFSEQAISDLEFASMLHDIGKIGISQAILNKPDKLTDAEFQEIMRHPATGAEIISEIPFLNECQVIIHQHHERIDGKGYPYGITGAEIHYSAKILAIVDAYDAMTSDRPYRAEPLTAEEALQELIAGRGTQFDAELVEAFARIIRSELAYAQDRGPILTSSRITTQKSV